MINPGLAPAVTQQGPQLGQVSQTARQANPVPQPMAPSGMSNPGAPQAAPQPKFQPQNSQDMIIAALIEQMRFNNSAQKQKTQPAPPQGLPMGGGGMMRPMMQPMSRMQMQDGMSGKPMMGGGCNYER